jgi:subtilisin family serine protease
MHHMLKGVARGGLVLAVLLLLAAAVVSADQTAPGGPVYHPERVLVKFNPKVGSAQVQQLAATQGLVELRSHPGIGLHVYRVPRKATVKDTIAALTASPAVVYAEPDWQVHAADVFPTDPLFPQQWALHNIGQTGGTADADIDAPEAWQINHSACSVIVGVIDTGVDYTHQDLACNIWTNPGEIPGNGIDDDGNGYVDDVHGYDWVNLDANPMDDHGHGTHVSGSIGACTDNGVGIAGVTNCVKIMALKFLDSSGSGWTSDAVSALLYATSMGAKLTSNSWGGGGYSSALRDAIAAADAAGCLFVAAAGNSGQNADLYPMYPAAYDLPNIISVAATDSNDQLAGFSNYGPTSVDLGAPGVDILSSLPGNQYAAWSGTSMATPHVSGAAALVWGANPSLTHDCVKGQILSTVDPLPALDGKTLTGGRLNLNNALQCDGSALQVLPAPGPGFDAGTWNTREGNPSVITAYVTACCPVPDAAVAASFDSGDPDLPMVDDGVAPDLYAGDGVFSGTWTPNAGGSVGVTVDATKNGLLPGTASFVAQVLTNVCYMYDIVPFDWQEISGTGTLLPLGCDDCYTPLPAAFDFNFYGIDRSQVWVSANGALYFEDRALTWVNGPLPTASAGTLIAPFWDDLWWPNVYYEVRGTAPNRVLILEWQNAQHYPSSPGGVTFEALLYEATGEMVFQYLDTSFSNSSYDGGASATVGIQGDGTQAVQYSYNSPSLYDGLAIRFSECGNYAWLTVGGAGQGTVKVDGNVVVVPTTLRYPIGATATVEAIPAPGWRFCQWTGCVADPSSTTTTVTMNQSTCACACFTQLQFDDDDPAIAYVGNWLSRSLGSATGGHVKYSVQTNAYADFSFYGTGLKWRVLRGPQMGKARIYFDGHPVTLMDLYSPSQRFEIKSKLGLACGLHTLRIQVSGQKNPSSSNIAVDVDEFQIVP